MNIVKLLSLIVLILTFTYACDKHSAKDEIVVYSDFKCPYCKKLDEKILPKLERDYLSNNKTNYEFKNVANLGIDSYIGAKAGNAIKLYAPDKYLTFQHNMFQNQPKNEKLWITNDVINKQFKKLNLSNKTLKKVKAEYNKTNGKSKKMIDKDIKSAKKQNVETVPTVFINGEKVKDPYKYKDYQELLN
ncbi:DsbA family protein [Staphylococcus gallinarum]|uniref:DsbA family protein n=1 Tax=Staphylococcus gallinarum TaxID=1293 RepID=UPI0030BDBF67